MMAALFATTSCTAEVMPGSSFMSIFSASSSVLRQLLFNRFCRSIRSVNIRARLTVADTFWT